MSTPIEPYSRPEPADPLDLRLRQALEPAPGAARRVVARALSGSRGRPKARLAWAAAGALAAALLLWIVAPFSSLLPGGFGRSGGPFAPPPGPMAISIESRGPFLVTRSESGGRFSIRQAGSSEPLTPGTVLIVRHGDSR